MLYSTNADEANKSDPECSLIYHADRIVIMTPKYFNTIKEDLHLTEGDEYFKETNDGVL